MAEIKGGKKKHFVVGENALAIPAQLWSFMNICSTHNVEIGWQIIFYSVFIQALGGRRASLFLLFVRYHDDPSVPLTS